MTNEQDTHADAWAFVLRHSDSMDRYSHRFAGALSPDDRAEWLQDVTLRVVEKFQKYDPAKSAPMTWIVWQMRAVTTNWTRRFKKRCREGYGSADRMVLIPIHQTAHGSEEHARTEEREADAAITISGLYANATLEQRLAIRTQLAGMPATTLRREHGMSGSERITHLRALRVHLPEGY